MQVLLVITAITGIITIILLFLFRARPGANDILSQKLDILEKSLDKITAALKDDFKTNREENSATAKDNRAELNDTLRDFKTEMGGTLQAITRHSQAALEQVNRTLEEKITALTYGMERTNQANRKALTASIRDFTTEQRSKTDELKQEQREMTTATAAQLEKITAKIEDRLAALNEQAKQDSARVREAMDSAFASFRDGFDKNTTAFSGQQQERFAQAEDSSRAGREAVAASLKDFTIEQRGKIDELRQDQRELTASTVTQLEKITVKVEAKLGGLQEQAAAGSSQVRDTLEKMFAGFGASFDKNMAAVNDLQREKFGLLEEKQDKLVDSTEKKLEQMRTTVEEKLQQTLQERIGQSFEVVSRQLESVQKGLGEMQALAQDVGGLKKVLSNVKMRGGIGEVQLAMLLEQVLAPEQYAANVKTKAGSADLVEFAIKLPGRDDGNSVVWLPVDAKFPKDVYEQLLAAYDTGDAALVEAAQKMLDTTMKKMARDIRDKYIDPPNTTDFGIMFLPFEGIYAEVVRKASLLDTLQHEYKIIVTGPTTLAAILNSLQMGFRTLAIQKRSSEVWKVLGAVKKEFESFGGMLEKAQKNIQAASGQIDDLIGTRTRAIQRKLKDIEVLDVPALPIPIAEIAEEILLEGDNKN